MIFLSWRYILLSQTGFISRIAPHLVAFDDLYNTLLLSVPKVTEKCELADTSEVKRSYKVSCKLIH